MPPRDNYTWPEAMPEADELIGQIISHYRIVERIGGGGMGVIFRR
jgi:hypothetical protein